MNLRQCRKNAAQNHLCITHDTVVYDIVHTFFIWIDHLLKEYYREIQRRMFPKVIVRRKGIEQVRASEPTVFRGSL